MRDSISPLVSRRFLADVTMPGDSLICPLTRRLPPLETMEVDSLLSVSLTRDVGSCRHRLLFFWPGIWGYWGSQVRLMDFSRQASNAELSVCVYNCPCASLGKRCSCVPCQRKVSSTHNFMILTDLAEELCLLCNCENRTRAPL